MKFLALAICLPMMFAAQSLAQLDPFRDMDALKQELQYLVDMVGIDHTEQMCENTMNNYVQAGGIINYPIPVFCKGAQMLIKLLHIRPDTTTTHAPRGKRSDLFDLDLDSLKNDVQMIVDLLGTDPTEQACEQVSHKLIADGTIFNVAVMCKSLPTLVHMLHIKRDPTTAMP